MDKISKLLDELAKGYENAGKQTVKTQQTFLKVEESKSEYTQVSWKKRRPTSRN
jgi:hypothetical protein